MYIAIAIFFVLGYSAIALEHPLHLNKAASALFIAAICWALLAIGNEYIFSGIEEQAPHFIEGKLLHHLGEIGGILFFLLGAMTIVEIIDAHDSFSLLTDRITTLQKRKLLLILSVITFFMSALLDNMTTSIVMSTLLRKLIKNKKDLWLFAGMIVIAANAGGVWSPIGDVTTIMLWIGGQITAVNIFMKLLIPGFISMIVPLIIIASRLNGNITTPDKLQNPNHTLIPDFEKKLILYLGVGVLLFVPVLKSITHLPPFMGILLGLSILWGVTEFLNKNKQKETKEYLSVTNILERVDTPSILFFLGILLAVAALQTAGHLNQLAIFLDQSIGNIWVINIIIGLFSSIVDNVPLVASAMGMYNISVYPQDHTFWELLAFCAGTGGSCLIIGSAAGVAVMGILKIDFGWYFRHISFPALIGYFAGIIAFWIINFFT